MAGIQRRVQLPQDEENMAFIMDATRSIRNIRSELNVLQKDQGIICNTGRG